MFHVHSLKWFFFLNALSCAGRNSTVTMSKLPSVGVPQPVANLLILGSEVSIGADVTAVPVCPVSGERVGKRAVPYEFPPGEHPGACGGTRESV